MFGPVYGVHLLLSFVIDKGVEAYRKRKQKTVSSDSDEDSSLNGAEEDRRIEEHRSNDAPPPYVA